MNNLQQIGIAQALAEMDITVQNGRPIYFSLDYVKKDGSLGRIARAQKNVKMPHTGGDQSPRSGFKYNLKEKGVVLVRNADTKEIRAILIPLLIRFNSIRIFH